jgi:hypothetical protein
LQRRGIFRHLGRDQVIRNQILQHLEPEQRDLGKDLALPRNAGAKHMVKRGDAVGGHQQQGAVHRIQIAHFASPKQGRGAQIRG